MDKKKVKVAYFCAEYGIDGFPFNGGLGILGGDFLKSCADLCLPVVGVGLHYKMGNFHQRLDQNGWQSEYYEPFFPTGILKSYPPLVKVPMREVDVPINALELIVHSSIQGEDNSVPLLFLNDIYILDRLYPGNNQMIERLKQEMILGIGGVRMLDALGFDNVDRYHSNEGHAALLTLALREKYGGLEEARKHMVFTTHTPVPAGIDVYTKEQAEQVMKDEMLEQACKSSGKGVVHMVKLAMDSSCCSFGVSRLHKEVSQRLFYDFPNIDRLDYIDNGVHLPTWVSSDVEKFYDKLTGGIWRKDPRVLEDKLAKISEEEVLTVRETSRYELGKFLQKNPRVRSNSDYDPNKLTIGFARRFARYKRATLIFDQIERMRKIGKYVQLVFAGKAHPTDDGGKEVIKEIFKYMKEEKDIPIWFVEDYDMTVARYMVRGVDLWLNNPRRLQEASGTSGMKAAANFVPQLSIIDGWWVSQDPSPGYNLPKGLVEGITGWGIGRMPTEVDFLLIQEDRKEDSKDLIAKLEGDILQKWEPKKEWRKKKEWAKVARGAASHNPPYFNTHRMALQYLKAYGLEDALEKLELQAV